MRPASRTSVIPGRRLLLLVSAGWLILGLGWWLWLGPTLLAAASESAAGPSPSWFARQIATRQAADPAWLDPEHVAWVGRTVLTRIGILWAAACLTVSLWPRRHRLLTGLASRVQEADDPRNLAVLRIATFATLLVVPAGREEFLVHLGLPEALRFPPGGLGPLVAALAPDPAFGRTVLLAWIAVVAMAAAGFLTRFSTIAAALLSILVLGVPQIHGKVNHAHHLVWFAMLLAASPCGDAWSLDSWIRGRRGVPHRDRRYGVPLRFAWLLLGFVYLFPGFWKLWTGGIDWFASDHLRNQIWLQWTTHGDWRPLVDPTGWPWLIRLGALGTIIFELSFVFLVLDRRTRPIAMILGLLFHNATWFTIHIGFVSLQICYLCLVDWAAIADRLRPRPAPRVNPPHATSPAAATAIGLLLVAVNGLYGMRGQHLAWPFACYPKFAYPVRVPERTVVEVVATAPDGTEIVESLATGRGELRTARWIGVITTVLREPDPSRRDAALVALADLAFDVPPGTTLRFDAVRRSVRPEDDDAPPLSRTTLGTFVTPAAEPAESTDPTT